MAKGARLKMSEAQYRARRRRQKADYQARYRNKKLLRGLIQVAPFVTLDSRPELYVLQWAFDAAPDLWFDPTAGSLKDRDGRHQQANTRTSPSVVLEQSVDGKFPLRAERIAKGQVKARKPR